MKILFANLLCLFVLLSSGVRAEDPAQLVTALKEYRAALKDGNVEAAVALTADFPKLPKALVEETTEKWSQMIQSGDLKLWFFPGSAKIEGDCGVVMIGDGDKPNGDDPAYLIRQDGKWKVIYELTNWKTPAPYFTTLTDAQTESLTKLSAYVVTQKKEMRQNPDAKFE